MMTMEEIRRLLIKRLAEAKKKERKSVVYIATVEMGLSSATFLYDCRAGRRAPSKRVLDWLGVDQLYVKRKPWQSASTPSKRSSSASKSPKRKAKRKVSRAV